jgi:hypothetical protein
MSKELEENSSGLFQVILEEVRKINKKFQES